jgi:Putative Flp pilus-assembly TadE/G-like
MVLMLCCVGLVVDVGHAMLVQRQLQAGVDAGALAGVQHLPEEDVAEDVARQYSAQRTPDQPITSRNAVNTVDNAVTTAEALCIPGVPGCNRRDGGFNGIKVRSTSTVPTWFGRIVGIKEMKVSAQSTACAPCSVKPLDIMVVLDRTGSMCQISNPNNPNQIINDPTCRDLNGAADGVESFLELMDPSLDRVGLALFPPTLNENMKNAACPYTPWDGSGRPNTTQTPPWPATNGRYYAYDQWWHPEHNDSPLGEDSSWYLAASLEGVFGDPNTHYIRQVGAEWFLNPASTLVQKLGCHTRLPARGAGSTSYALSIESAQRELARNGRGNVQDVIIFLSDGGANTTPTDVPAGHWTNNPSAVATPCQNGVQAASNAKGAGATVIAIGYDLAKSSSGGTAEPCRRPNIDPNSPNYGHQSGSTLEACGTWGTLPVCDAEDALMAIASLSDPTDPASLPMYYYAPGPDEVIEVFRQIAIDLSGSRGRLIDDTAPNILG